MPKIHDRLQQLNWPIHAQVIKIYAYISGFTTRCVHDYRKSPIN